MINTNKTLTQKIAQQKKVPYEQVTAQRHKRSSIHKCPVNTLLTIVFSGIAWNG